MNPTSNKYSVWFKNYLLGLVLFMLLYILMHVLLHLTYKVFFFDEKYTDKTYINVQNVTEAMAYLNFYFVYMAIGSLSSKLLLIILPFFRKRRSPWLVASISIIPINFFLIGSVLRFLRQLMNCFDRSISVMFLVFDLALIVFIVVYFFKFTSTREKKVENSKNLLDLEDNLTH